MNARRAFAPQYAVPPGATIADLAEERSLTQDDLASKLGVSPKHINQVIHGKATITTDLAVRLERVLGPSAEFWTRREATYRVALAREKEAEDLASWIPWAAKFPLAEMRKRGLIKYSKAGTEEAVAAVLTFFGVATPTQWAEPTVAFRKSLTVESDDYALAVWLRIGEIEAQQIDCAPYDADRFRSILEEARGYTKETPEVWHPWLVARCAEAGVAVVVVDTVKGARANGATRWLSPSKAVLQLSLRGRWEDVFWFSFFHEAGHIVKHSKKGVFVEGLGLGDDPEQRTLEAEADSFATKILIPGHLEARLRKLAFHEIPAFANEVGVSPAIIVGRLQHEKLLPYTHGNQMRRRLAFADES